ncbi:MAG: 1,4-alpha-glucan branching protein GlgB [Candidatus Binataceae bacterium]
MNQPEFDAIATSEVANLLALRHPDPHSVLGAHANGSGVTIRVFNPHAEEVSVLGAGGAAQSMLHGADGLFQLSFNNNKDVFPYQLRIQYSDGHVRTCHDPYSYPPTIGNLDLHLWGEGRHHKIFDKLGAHPRTVAGVAGTAFAVWAPNAEGASVVGDFNGWDGRIHMMRVLGSSGIWELFIPELEAGEHYKFEIRTTGGGLLMKADPFANGSEVPPRTASNIYHSEYSFGDSQWIEQRASRDSLRSPLSIYEMHLGSWRHVPEENDRPLTYREIAPQLADYVNDLGFTHVELMPVMEHPFLGSWGYQVTGYYTPTSRWGKPDDFRFLVDYLHQRGIGVILDWVPGHFPTDAFALGRFDGTALYEHLDPRKGYHPEWNTYIFNFGRNEVRNFLVANALYWLGEYHADGLRVDAVASMLYLDYARRSGEWIPNKYGGNENLEAIDFIKEVNDTAYRQFPGTMMIAEESTSWPAVTRPPYAGGLGFGFKWDMGWMHDTLDYFSRDSIHRRYHQRDITFGFLYAWSENYILPLSHDEVVYGKRSMIAKMPGDRWRQFANLRALYAYMWARPGKKMIFMGGEFAQWNEWNHDHSLDWHLLDYSDHRGIHALIRTLNHIYREEPALWEADVEPPGFHFIDADNADDNVVAFLRTAPASGRRIICVCNFSPVVREHYRIGAPADGLYREVLNTDSALFGGSNVGNRGAVAANRQPYHGFGYSLSLTLPPLAVIWLEVPRS